MTKRNTAIDGLRFFAVTLVVASHCQFLKQGGLGNSIFFALSGFLAMRPFVKDAEKDFTDILKILKYYLSRIIRIVPVFWFCIIAAWALVPVEYFNIRDMESFHSLVLNMFFVKSQGHLWFLQQEMLFYAVFPLIALAVYAVKSVFAKFLKNTAYGSLAAAFLLIVFSLLCNKYLTEKVFWVYGNNGQISFRIGQFTLGTAAGLIYRAYVDSGMDRSKKTWFNAVSNVYCIFFVLFCILSAEPILMRFDPSLEGTFVGWKYPMFCGALACGYMLLTTAAKDCFMNKVMGNRLFAYLGGISFVIYLIHWYLLPSFENPDVVKRFILVYFVSLACAGIINKYIEKPMMKLAKTMDFRDVAGYYKNI